MRPDPKSDAGRVLVAIEETGTLEAGDLARRIGWVKLEPPMMALTDAHAEEWIEVKLGGSRYHVERVETALAALDERGIL